MHRCRRLLCLIAVALAASRPVCAQQPQARIKLDPTAWSARWTRTSSATSPSTSGAASTAESSRKAARCRMRTATARDVLEAARGLGLTLLRWPGGNFASGYNWKDGIGPRDQRPVRRDHAWGAIETNRFGTDEFLRYCERLKVDPYLCINAGLGSVEDARQWVEYTQRGGEHLLGAAAPEERPRPTVGVKYWGLGNEIDGPWQLGHKNAADYATFALEAAKAMRRVDDSIRLIASGSSNFRPGADWVGWNRTVLERLHDEIDYISLHTYIGNPENDVERFLAASRDIDDRIEVVKGQIQAVRVGRPNARPIHIAFDEWNVWYRARTGTTEYEIASTGLEEIYNFEDALAMGMFLNSFFRHADVVKMANLAQLVNVIAPIFTNRQGLYLQTIYFPLAEYAKQRGQPGARRSRAVSRVQARQAGARSATWTCPPPTTRRPGRCSSTC